MLQPAQVDNSPLRVAVEHLNEPKERADDDVLRATQIQLVATLRDLVQLHPLYSEQLRAFAGFGGDFENVARLADVCASLTSADSEQLQKILEELDATQRWAPACTHDCAGSGGETVQHIQASFSQDQSSVSGLQPEQYHSARILLTRAVYGPDSQECKPSLCICLLQPF